MTIEEKFKQFVNIIETTMALDNRELSKDEFYLVEAAFYAGIVAADSEQ